eukprot:270528-Chlamydomonas_euryale.AAC.3
MPCHAVPVCMHACQECKFLGAPMHAGMQTCMRAYTGAAVPHGAMDAWRALHAWDVSHACHACRAWHAWTRRPHGMHGAHDAHGVYRMPGIHGPCQMRSVHGVRGLNCRFHTHGV